MAYLPAQRLRLYRNFKAIDAADHHGIIRYFEQYEDEIRTLDDDEYFDCAYTYAEALFSVGSYRQAVVMQDHLIEWVILHNVSRWSGQDILARLLVRKAETLLQQQRWHCAERVLREYAKLYPSDRYGWRLLGKSLLRQRPTWLRYCWAVSIGLFFASLTAAAAELFIVRPFFRLYGDAVLATQQLLMTLALATALSSEGIHWYRCRRNLRIFATQIRAQSKR
ncbi:MAG: hypothetical protein RMJ33_00465 [Saprospiraceae bacterium]|nr:hypothetical protein [Saprospiraceae bacterium]